MPKHSHHGSEFTLVVAGGFTDESGSFGPGD
ncbi:MAG: cupin domain-containing protein, partial [Pseudomonadota bacterium]